MKRGDWQGTLREFSASAAINERKAPCHGNMGLCHAWMGHKAEALAELRALTAQMGEIENPPGDHRIDHHGIDQRLTGLELDALHPAPGFQNPVKHLDVPASQV